MNETLGSDETCEVTVLWQSDLLDVNDVLVSVSLVVTATDLDQELITATLDGLIRNRALVYLPTLTKPRGATSVDLLVELTGPTTAEYGETINYQTTVSHTEASQSPVCNTEFSLNYPDVNGVSTPDRGDDNVNTCLDPGETWHYSNSYTIPQPDDPATTVLRNEAVFAGQENQTNRFFSFPDTWDTIVSCPVVFADNFSDSSSGWQVPEDYVASEYRVQGIDNAVVYDYPPSIAVTDYEVEVTARWAPNNTDGKAYGLVFHLDPEAENYYFYQVNVERQQYRLLLRFNNRWQVLTGQWRDSPAITTADTRNHLKVVLNDAQIDLYINDTFLATVDDGTLTNGLAGLAVEAPTGYMAFFDNYQLKSCVSAQQRQGIPAMGGRNSSIATPE